MMKLVEKKDVVSGVNLSGIDARFRAEVNEWCAGKDFYGHAVGDCWFLLESVDEVSFRVYAYTKYLRASGHSGAETRVAVNNSGVVLAWCNDSRCWGRMTYNELGRCWENVRSAAPAVRAGVEAGVGVGEARLLQSCKDFMQVLEKSKLEGLLDDSERGALWRFRVAVQLADFSADGVGEPWDLERVCEVGFEAYAQVAVAQGRMHLPDWDDVPEMVRESVRAGVRAVFGAMGTNL